jgi:glutamine amidotransferase
MITIIDYKVGNLGSIQNMLKKIGQESVITSDHDKISIADKLILPGVGAFGNGMGKIEELGLKDIINKKVLEEKTPILGICLGAQLMTKCSEEGGANGFAWVDADTKRFNIEKDSRLKVPHMGWNDVNLKKSSKLFHDMHDDPRFYFVHSYHFNFNNNNQVLLTTDYSYEFVSAFEFENILGVQFHPEKSHKFGMKLLKNFSELY